MPTTITEVTNAFEYLYHAMYDKRFSKTLCFTHQNERALLPLVRCYLLGYFNRLEPEMKVEIEENQSGYIDFVIDGIAVELAVRNSNQNRVILQRNANEKEIKKLMVYPKGSILILFDFGTDTTYEKVQDILSQYRKLPTFPHHTEIYPFNVVYFYINEEGMFEKSKIQVRVN